METTRQTITIDTVVKAPVEKVWNLWNEPQHIMRWCQASDDWHAPEAENDVREGGKFRTLMAAKDGSFSFEFGGVYDKVKEHQLIEYTLGDGRKVKVLFAANSNETTVTETFDPESTNPPEMQRAGWQAILNNFKNYVETN